MYITKFEDCGYDLLEEDYFIWLCERVDADGPDKGYMNLMHELYEHEFSERTARLIGNDENRIEDGIELRNRFLQETGLKGYIGGFCSVLEVLVALAFRIQDMYGYEDAPFWFWEMIRNCGLNKFTDSDLSRPNDFRKLRNRIDDVITRNYDKDGFGSLFPGLNLSRNSAKMEIWEQMNRYVLVNYMN